MPGEPGEKSPFLVKKKHLRLGKTGHIGSNIFRAQSLVFLREFDTTCYTDHEKTKQSSGCFFSYDLSVFYLFDCVGEVIDYFIG